MNIFSGQKFLLLLKAVVFVLMTWFIVDQLFFKNDFKSQLNFFLQHIKSEGAYLFIIAVLLMPVNWILETIKWRLLIKAESSFLNLLKSVIAGITFGFITPARSGEFIGRVMYLEEDDKAKVFYLSSIGGIAQSAVTLFAGVFFAMAWSDNPVWWETILGVSVIFLLFYFRFDLFNRFISVIPILERNSLIIHNDELPKIQVQLNVLLISFLRYAVYLFQYVLLFLFFGVSDNVFALLVHSGVFLVAQTCSPLMPFLDFSFRGGSALYVFKDFSTNNIAVLTAVTFVWILNLVIPSLIGYLFILRKRL